MREWELRGAVEQLFANGREPEMMVDGPRGTGKSTGIQVTLATLHELYPGIRGLWIQKDRKRMTEATLVSWESVLGHDHPALASGGHRSHRSHYVWPNRSEVALFGLDTDDLGRLRGAQFDYAVFWQAEQITHAAWQEVTGGNIRSGVLPWQFALADANPGPPTHWLLKRVKAKSMRRMKSVHTDNPRYCDRDGTLHPWGIELQGRLDRLVGAMRGRYRDGLWVSEDGQIIPFDLLDQSPNAVICEAPDRKLMSRWLISIDWGVRDVGCAQVWGMTPARVKYRFAEVYARGKGLRWWTGMIHQLAREFPEVQQGVFDSPDPTACDAVNFTMHRVRPEAKLAFFVRPDKSRGRFVSIDSLRTEFAEERVKLCKGAKRFHDAGLEEDALPTCLEEELPQVVWAEAREGHDLKEDVAPGRADHAFDGARYANDFWEPRVADLSQPVEQPSLVGGEAIWVPADDGSWKLTAKRSDPDNED